MSRIVQDINASAAEFTTLVCPSISDPAQMDIDSSVRVVVAETIPSSVRIGPVGGNATDILDLNYGDISMAFLPLGGIFDLQVRRNGSDLLHMGASDRRIKKNIVNYDMGDVKTILGNIQIRQFDVKTTQELADDRVGEEYPLREGQQLIDSVGTIGLVAQEVADAFPVGAVGDPTSNRAMGVNGDTLTLLLIATCQQLIADNVALAARVTILETV